MYDLDTRKGASLIRLEITPEVEELVRTFDLETMFFDQPHF